MGTDTCTTISDAPPSWSVMLVWLGVAQGAASPSRVMVKVSLPWPVFSMPTMKSTDSSGKAVISSSMIETSTPLTITSIHSSMSFVTDGSVSEVTVTLR